MQYDEGRFLDLLHKFQSEESKKYSRNANFMAFIVIGVWLLDIKLNDIKFLGVDLTKRLIRTPNLVEFEAALISEEKSHLAVNGEETHARRIEVFGPKIMIFRHSKTSGSPDNEYM